MTRDPLPQYLTGPSHHAALSICTASPQPVCVFSFITIKTGFCCGKKKLLPRLCISWPKMNFKSTVAHSKCYWKKQRASHFLSLFLSVPLAFSDDDGPQCFHLSLEGKKNKTNKNNNADIRAKLPWQLMINSTSPARTHTAYTDQIIMHTAAHAFAFSNKQSDTWKQSTTKDFFFFFPCEVVICFGTIIIWWCHFNGIL